MTGLKGLKTDTINFYVKLAELGFYLYNSKTFKCYCCEYTMPVPLVTEHLIDEHKALIICQENMNKMNLKIKELQNTKMCLKCKKKMNGTNSVVSDTTSATSSRTASVSSISSETDDSVSFFL